MINKTSSNSTPAISLILSFYNNTRLLLLVFEALSRQTFQDFEVIIADDGSDEEAVECIHQLMKKASFTVKHCWHEDKGWRKNIILNKAIETSDSDYLVFIDGDCIPHRCFLEDHFSNRKDHFVLSGRRVQLSQKRTDLLSTKQIKDGFLEKGTGLLLLLLDGIFEKVKHSENAIRVKNRFLRKYLIKDKRRGILGCNFSIHKSDILLVNGFDERYNYPGTGEDSDLDHRLQRAGIFCYSRKHLLTMYHIYHKKFDLVHAPNLKLLKDNDDQGITFTPFGIHKG